MIPDDQWLGVAAVMDLTGASLPTVRAWLQERELVGARRGPNHALLVPATFLTPQGPVKHLRGTITVLTDSGLDDSGIIRWLHEPDDTLPGGSPIAALREGHKTEVRRRAQELAL